MINENNSIPTLEEVRDADSIVQSNSSITKLNITETENEKQIQSTKKKTEIKKIEKKTLAKSEKYPTKNLKTEIKKVEKQPLAKGEINQTKNFKNEKKEKDEKQSLAKDEINAAKNIKNEINEKVKNNELSKINNLSEETQQIKTQNNIDKSKFDNKILYYLIEPPNVKPIYSEIPKQMNITNNSPVNLEVKNKNVTNVVGVHHQANLYVNFLDSELSFHYENSRYSKIEEGFESNPDYQKLLEEKVDDPNNVSIPTLND